MNSLEQICNVIKSNGTFSIYSHMHTDIDAIGSSLALKRILEKLGKKADVFIDSNFPDNASMFEDIDLINSHREKQYDVAIVLDLNDDSRLARLKYKYRKNVKTTILIDHHLGSTEFAKYNYITTEVSSTCEIIYKIGKLLGVEFDKELCKLLICGMYTDTGSLIFSNTFPSTHEAIADLQRMSGYIMDELSVPLFNNMSKGAFELRRLAYSRLELFNGDNIAFIYFKASDFKNLQVDMSETKGITDIALQIGSVNIVVMASEIPDEENTFYISLRTKGDYSSRNIALEFGGGGHLKASGCKMSGKLDDIKKQILSVACKELDRVRLRKD